MCDRWSEWVAHDGAPRPDLVGCYVRVRSADGRAREGVLMPGAMRPRSGRLSLWVWHTLPGDLFFKRVVYYRVRQPRGMAVLRELVASPQCPVFAGVS